MFERSTNSAGNLNVFVFSLAERKLKNLDY